SRYLGDPLFSSCSRGLAALHSFPTRRSSDLSASRPTKGAPPEASPGCWESASPAMAEPSPRRRNSKRPRPSSDVVASAITSPGRSEEHTSELQSRENLVCRLLLEKKK